MNDKLDGNNTPEEATEFLKELPRTPRGSIIYGATFGAEVDEIIDNKSVNELLNSIKSGIAHQLRVAAKNGYQMSRDEDFKDELVFNQYIDNLSDDELLDAFDEEVKYK